MIITMCNRISLYGYVHRKSEFNDKKYILHVKTTFVNLTATEEMIVGSLFHDLYFNRQ